MSAGRWSSDLANQSGHFLSAVSEESQNAIISHQKQVSEIQQFKSYFSQEDTILYTSYSTLELIFRILSRVYFNVGIYIN